MDSISSLQNQLLKILNKIKGLRLVISYRERLGWSQPWCGRGSDLGLEIEEVGDVDVGAAEGTSVGHIHREWATTCEGEEIHRTENAVRRHRLHVRAVDSRLHGDARTKAISTI